MGEDINNDFSDKTALRPLFRIVDTIERLHAISGLDLDSWLDLLETTWSDYYHFRSGLNSMSYISLHNLSHYFGIEIEDILSGQVNFQDLTQKMTKTASEMPDQFMIAPFGRMRTTITSLEYLENQYGWRLKHDVLQRFGVKETSLLNPFAPVSIRFITQVCDYLQKRQFKAEDFFKMGTYSYQGNKNSLIAKLTSEISDYREAFEAFEKLMPLFERNCTYKFVMISDTIGVVTCHSNRDVAEALGVAHVGSENTCYLKSGMWASIASYFNITLPKVTHPQCEHRGDGVCRYIVDFSGCQRLTSELLQA